MGNETRGAIHSNLGCITRSASYPVARPGPQTGSLAFGQDRVQLAPRLPEDLGRLPYLLG